jgi:two-component sensor histidine kinase
MSTALAIDDFREIAHDRTGITVEYLLVREITHRVKNELTAAISAASLVATRSANSEVKLALSNVIELLHNFARVHCALDVPSHASDIDASDHLGTLCLSISRSKLSHRNIRLIFVGNTVLLSADRCWRLGMIASELITNAERHAFRSDGGTIHVELFSAGQSIGFRVADDGHSRVPTGAGHGLKIVEALAHSLGGKVFRKFGTEGSETLLTFPS